MRYFAALESIIPEAVMKYGIAGLMIRLALAPIAATTYDVYPGYAAIMSLLGGRGIYDERMFGYPPLFLFLVYPLMFVLAMFVGPGNFARTPSDVYEFSVQYGTISPTVTSPIFNILYKTPMIIADMLVGMLLYRLMYRMSQSPDNAKRAYLLWFLNPLVIHTSMIHGSFDSVCVLFALLVVYRFTEARYFESGAFLALGLITKVFPIFLLPVLLGALVGESFADKSQAIRANLLSLFENTLRMGLGGLLIILLFLAPLMGFLGALNTRTAFSDISGFNVFFIQYCPFLGWNQGVPYDLASTQYFLSAIEYILLGILGALVAVFYLRHRGSDSRVLITSIAMSSMVVAFSMPNSYPQYFLWFIPFLALLSDRRQMIAAILLFSIAGIIWEYAIQGVLAYFYPLAVFSSFLTTNLVNGSIAAFLALPGFLNATLRYDFFLLSTLLAFSVFVIVMIQGVVQIAKRV